MAGKFNDGSIKVARFNNQDVKLIRFNSRIAWVKPFTLTINNNGTNLIVERLLSVEPTASLGVLHNGDTIYYGDRLAITNVAVEGWVNPTHTSTGLDQTSRVTGNVVITGSATRIKWNLHFIKLARSEYSDSDSEREGLFMYNYDKPQYPSNTICVLRIEYANGSVHEDVCSTNNREEFTYTDLDYDDKAYIIQFAQVLKDYDIERGASLSLLFNDNLSMNDVSLRAIPVEQKIRINPPSRHQKTIRATYRLMSTTTHNSDVNAFYLTMSPSEAIQNAQSSGGYVPSGITTCIGCTADLGKGTWNDISLPAVYLDYETVLPPNSITVTYEDSYKVDIKQAQLTTPLDKTSTTKVGFKVWYRKYYGVDARELT